MILSGCKCLLLITKYSIHLSKLNKSTSFPASSRIYLKTFRNIAAATRVRAAMLGYIHGDVKHPGTRIIGWLQCEIVRSLHAAYQWNLSPSAEWKWNVSTSTRLMRTFNVDNLCIGVVWCIPQWICPRQKRVGLNFAPSVESNFSRKKCLKFRHIRIHRKKEMGNIKDRR